MFVTLGGLVLSVGLFLVVWPILDALPFPGSTGQYFLELWIPGIPLTWLGMSILRRGWRLASELGDVRTPEVRRSSRKKRHGDCCYCGEPASTVDHVPSRKLFPEPRPSDLITVPSCAPCNNRLSAQEIYVLHVLLSHREADTPVAGELREQLFARERTPRRVGMAQRMLSSMGSAPLLGPEGVCLGYAPTFTIDRQQFDPVIEKITRGLYWDAFSERVPTARVSEVFLTPPPDWFQHEVVKSVIHEGVGRSIGNQAFEYRIGRAPEPPGVAMCVMLFFGTIPVICNLVTAEGLAAAEGNTEES